MTCPRGANSEPMQRVPQGWRGGSRLAGVEPLTDRCRNALRSLIRENASFARSARVRARETGGLMLKLLPPHGAGSDRLLVKRISSGGRADGKAALGDRGEPSGN